MALQRNRQTRVTVQPQTRLRREVRNPEILVRWHKRPRAPAAVRENPSAGPASGSTGISPLPPAAGYGQGPRVYPTPVPVLPPAPINPRVVELTQKYSDLDREILGLVEKGRKTQDAAEKARLRKQIQGLVARQFDLRQEARELEVERLRKQLTEVEQTIGRHKGLKEKVVEHRVTELLDENAELKWEPLAGAPGGVRAVQETVVELEQVLPDGTRVKVPRTVVRVLPEGQTPVPPSSSYLPPRLQPRHPRRHLRRASSRAA